VTNHPAPFLPDWASPPGETLADLLEEHSLTQTELAQRLGVTLKHVNRVVKGAAPISAELALGLEKVFGAPASFWMTREAHFQADKARHQQRLEFADALGWARRFPLKELRERGFITTRYNQDPELVEQLLSFLGIAHPAQWTAPQVAYRKSQRYESDPHALAAWLREGALQATELDTAPYDEGRFLDALLDARSLTRQPPRAWCPTLQDLCAAAGVAVAIVDTYSGARANGATRWLAPDKALIQLSLRHHWEDIFWFSFFHEAAHVALHRKKGIFVDGLALAAPGRDAEAKRLEDEADRFASRILIPEKYEARLRQLPVAEIQPFADELGIAPAIVVGRLQHEGLMHYRESVKYKRRLHFVD
jgi:HTH-type transcriptional regulator / antitoxin HigA